MCSGLLVCAYARVRRGSHLRQKIPIRPAIIIDGGNMRCNYLVFFAFSKGSSGLRQVRKNVVKSVDVPVKLEIRAQALWSRAHCRDESRQRVCYIPLNRLCIVCRLRFSRRIRLPFVDTQLAQIGTQAKRLLLDSAQ